MRWIGVLSMSMLAAGSCGFLAQASHTGEIREFYIKTVHIDGQTSTKGDADHKPEPFPDTAMPEGKASS